MNVWTTSIEEQLQFLTDRVIFLENQLKIVNSQPIEKPELLTDKEIVKEFRISRTTFYKKRKEDNITPKGYKGKIKLYDRYEVEKSVIKRVG